MSLSKAILLDKIRGGWCGKNIGGTLGGPLEGRMELLDAGLLGLKPEGPAPNDDLDLQLVNLHCLEQYGARITAAHIGKEWVSHVFFPFDEYGHALTNLRRGIEPPLAGCYNNLFTDCMGSPIRSELWAMVAAGNPKLAAYYALQDASVDHAGGEGAYGEIFFAVMECLAFEESDRHALIEKALGFIPADCETAKAVRDMVAYHGQGLYWEQARQNVIRRYATPNFTYAPVNIAFVVLGLLYGNSFSVALYLACRCGYDTDCTAATLGAILGIMGGMAAIPPEWSRLVGDEIRVSDEVNGFCAPADIDELTDRTYRMYRLVQAEWESIPDRGAFRLDFECRQHRWLLPPGSFTDPELAVAMTLEGDHPAVGRGGKRISLTLENRLKVPYTGSLRLELPAGLASGDRFEVALAAGEAKRFDFAVRREGDGEFRYECIVKIERRINATLWSGCSVPFTLVPAAQWRISGKKASMYIESPMALIDFSALPDWPAAEPYKAETTLELPDGRHIDFIVSAAAPVTLKVDGDVLFACEAPTPFIPAYHRSAKEKRASRRLAAGRHDIEITIGKPSEGEIAFYMVEPAGEGSFAHFIDYRLQTGPSLR